MGSLPGVANALDSSELRQAETLILSDDPLLTVAEVARALRVSSMTIYREINDGELPALRIGGTWRIRTSAVEHYLARAASR